MAKLVMALRCIDGAVLAGDAPFEETSEDEDMVRPLSESVAALMHDDRPFGNRLVSEFLASAPELDLPIGKIAEQACSFFDNRCQQLADQNQPVPFPLGIIIAGIDEDGAGDIAFYGLHIGNRFTPRAFEGNVFGGQYNSIARLLDSKMYTFSIGVDSALRLAAFYYTETKSIPVLKLEPGLSLATITYNNGFEKLDREQTRDLLTEASHWSEKLFAACSSAFSPILDSETEGRK